MVLSKRHLILYTIGTYMGAPKENKIPETNFELSKVHLHPFQKLSYFSFQMIHIRARGVTLHALCLLLLAPIFKLNINSYTDLGIT